VTETTVTIPRSLAVLLAGTILAASLTACGGSPAAPSGAPPTGATSPTQRPFLATFAANQRRMEPTREAEKIERRLQDLEHAAEMERYCRSVIRPSFGC
jgi:hypothetical protein